MKVTVRDLEPDDWPQLAKLFGERGACGGCWCMAWRLRGRQWEERRGESNKRSFRRLVKIGKAKGCLAFAGDDLVGWCSVGPRADFQSLVHTRALKSDWDEHTWSVTCFFITKEWRGQGVATKLLKGAVRLARTEGAKRLEGYPALPYKYGKSMPAAFAWTGVPALFEKAGFKDIRPEGQRRPVYARRFRPEAR